MSSIGWLGTFSASTCGSCRNPSMARRADRAVDAYTSFSAPGMWSVLASKFPGHQLTTAVAKTSTEPSVSFWVSRASGEAAPLASLSKLAVMLLESAVAGRDGAVTTSRARGEPVSLAGAARPALAAAGTLSVILVVTCDDRWGPRSASARLSISASGFSRWLTPSADCLRSCDRRSKLCRQEVHRLAVCPAEDNERLGHQLDRKRRARHPQPLGGDALAQPRHRCRRQRGQARRQISDTNGGLGLPVRVWGQEVCKCCWMP